MGSGDAEFGFNMYMSTFGTVHLGHIDTQTGGIHIRESAGHIEVFLDQ